MDKADETKTILVELYSEKLECLTTETLTLSSSFPSTIQAIKERVEECYSIPACVQKIYYQDTELPDSISLESLCIRSGEALRISFPAKGETRDVKEVVEWLHLLISQFHDLLQEKEGIADHCLAVDDPLYSHNSAELLNSTLFLPAFDPVKIVNGRYFKALQGVMLIAKLHHQIIDLKKCITGCPVLVYLERVCLGACVDYTVNKSCIRDLVSCGELENCIAAFLMKDADDVYLLENDQCSIVALSLSVISNISEISEVQEYLSNKSDVIKQCFVAANSAFYTSDTALDVMIFLLCISRCQKAHENLFNPELIGNIIVLCQKNGETLDLTKIYASVFFAQIICGSTHLLQKLSVSTLIEIKSLMDQVSSLDPMEIRKCEIEKVVYWQSFLNCVEFLYSPPLSAEATHILANGIKTQELYLLSVGAILHFLQSALGRSEHVEILVEENLLDFIIALPWNIPSVYENKATFVVRELAKIYPIRPLLLSSLAKAKLAKSTWGLKKMMEFRSFQELV